MYFKLNTTALTSKARCICWMLHCALPNFLSNKSRLIISTSDLPRRDWNSVTSRKGCRLVGVSGLFVYARELHRLKHSAVGCSFPKEEAPSDHVISIKAANWEITKDEAIKLVTTTVSSPSILLS